MWWHRDLAPAHTSRAVRYWRNDETHTHIRTARDHAGEQVRLQGWVHRRRELAKVTFLIVRDRTGLAQVVLPAGTDVPPEETPVEVVGTLTANAQAPGGVEVTDATVTALSEPADTPAVELWRPTLDAGLPTLLDHAAIDLAPPAPASEVGARRRQPARLPRDARRGWVSPRSRRPSSSSRRPRAAPTSSRSTTSAGRRTSPRARSSTSSSWSGVFERVYEVGPVFRAEPHDTVRHLAEYVSLDVELGFVEDHRDVMACLRDVVAGMVAGVQRVRRARGRAARHRRCRRCRRRSRRCTSATRSRSPARRPTSPTWPRPRARAGRVGAWRSTARDFLRRRRLPDGPARVLQPPRPGGPALVPVVRPDLPWRRAGQRRPAAAPVRRLRPRARAARSPLRAVRVVRRGLPARHPAARRLRDRPGAVGRPAGRGAEHPRGHALPARPAPAGAVTLRSRVSGAGGGVATCTPPPAAARSSRSTSSVWSTCPPSAKLLVTVTSKPSLPCCGVHPLSYCELASGRYDVRAAAVARGHLPPRRRPERDRQ